MTNREACIAILTEARDSEEFKGETWPQSALDQVAGNATVDRLVNESWNSKGLQVAVRSFESWDVTEDGWYFWNNIARSEAVRNFKPKTQWPTESSK